MILRHLNGLPAGNRPYTLIDYFPDDFLIMIDESHVMLPQLRAMYAGDRSRKSSLVEYGFRLPCTRQDNRPLQFEEFRNLAHQCIYVGALRRAPMKKNRAAASQPNRSSAPPAFSIR